MLRGEPVQQRPHAYKPDATAFYSGDVSSIDSIDHCVVGSVREPTGFGKRDDALTFPVVVGVGGVRHDFTQ